MPTFEKVPISVLIPTFNEELNLADCLRSVVGWADEVVVVDSYSADRTLKICEEFGATVYQHPYEGPAHQKNWALDSIPWRNEWMLILDADERVPQPLRDEVRDMVEQNGAGHEGFHLNRRYIFFGRWLKHTWYPSWNLRLFVRSRGRYEQRAVHEHLILQGKAGYLRNDLIHEDHRGLHHLIEKHNRYATGEADEYLRVLTGQSAAEFSANPFRGALERRRFVKRYILPKLPFRYFFVFLYLYILKRGFLDGRQGFYFCLLQVCSQAFISLKLWEEKIKLESSPKISDG